MIKIENVKTYGWEAAIRGMRNPMNSWDKSDTVLSWLNWDKDVPEIGPNDRKLMQNLAEAGRDHSKYRRMIFVSMDIIAPLYWWKEFDTYKVGTVANSCSTMHKIHSRDLTIQDFSIEHMYLESVDCMNNIIDTINAYRRCYEKTHDKKYWWQIIQLLPSSYNQRRTVTLNYEVLANMHKSRQDHRLDEWVNFCEWIESLPYSEIITLDF